MEKLEEQKSYLSFRLGNESFASNVHHVLSILEVPRITEIPHSPDYIKGVMNLRGKVLPVIDSRVKFGMLPTKITANTCVLVLEVLGNSDNVIIGALVDNVDEVLEIEIEDIKPSPTIGSKYSTDFILGLAQKNEGFIMILDMNMVFSDEDISLLDRITEPDVELREVK